MENWVCPECQRTFGRKKQGHMCAPGMSIDEFFADSADYERPIYERIRAHLEDVGPVVVEAVQVGIFFKNGPNFAEIRPKKKWVAVTFKLPEKLSSNRLSRKVVPVGGQGSNYYHVVNVTSVDEVDGQLLDWLTAAYIAAED